MMSRTYLRLFNIRLWFHVVAFLHLSFVAIVSLSIDTSVDEDVRVQAYMHLRWKLFTCWYNMITLAYLPICIYLDFREKERSENPHLQKIRYLTDVVMTAILFPGTMYGGIFFWMLMVTNKSLIAPPRLFDYMPQWGQHSLHSVSMVMVILDILLTPRTRPKSLVPRLLLGVAFGVVYTLMLYISYYNGEIVYPLMERFSTIQSILFVSASYVLHISFYFIQWIIIDLIWNCKVLKVKLKDKL